MLFSVVWTWWISVFLVAGVILAIVSVIGGYLFFVTSKQYPSRKQRNQQSSS